MLQESERCHQIRNLLAPVLRDNDWFRQAGKLLGHKPTTLKDADKIMEAWQSDWGEVTFGRYEGKPAVTWNRPDSGPDLMEVSERPVSETLVRVALQAELIKALHDAGLESYVEKGKPDHWRRCRVFAGDKEMELVLWACAITGQCEALARGHNGMVKVNGEELTTQHIRARITIVVSEKDLGFF